MIDDSLWYNRKLFYKFVRKGIKNHHLNSLHSCPKIINNSGTQTWRMRCTSRYAVGRHQNSRRRDCGASQLALADFSQRRGTTLVRRLPDQQQMDRVGCSLWALVSILDLWIKSGIWCKFQGEQMSWGITVKQNNLFVQWRLREVSIRTGNETMKLSQYQER